MSDKEPKTPYLVLRLKTLKMFLLHSLLLLVVSLDFGYSIPDNNRLTGSRTLLFSCRELGGSCILKGTVKSIAGRTTRRCFGQRECDDGFSCCVYLEYKALIAEMKRRRKKRQAVSSKPVRQGTCRKLKSCTKVKGECRSECLADETDLKAIKNKSGCKNGCVCCVRDDVIVSPSNLMDCKANGGRCTTKKKPVCDPQSSETLADDKFSCKSKGGKFVPKCCAKGESGGMLLFPNIGKVH